MTELLTHYQDKNETTKPKARFKATGKSQSRTIVREVGDFKRTKY